MEGLQNTEIKIQSKIKTGCEVLKFKAPKSEKSIDSATDRVDDAKLLISCENVDRCQRLNNGIDFDEVSPFPILSIQQLLIVNQKDGSVQRLLLPSPLPLSDPSAQYILGQSLSVTPSGLCFAPSSSVRCVKT
uniref:Uncharacterized protein n=1 Tax=Romanomermis culicivorax TaxID=13658 RepID=A0A915L4W1_ROMCU